ncbi:MAG: apolipoprotein N-acyltransferase [Thermodesulfobacteriota bacterium]
MKKILRIEYILAVLSGILFTLPFLSKHLSLLAWISLVPLLYALESTPRNSFRTGLIFGTVVNYMGQYWLVGTLTRFGGFPLVVSFLFILIYCVYLGIQYALFTYLINKLKLIQNRNILNLFIISSLWVALEHFYPVLFPYGLGNTQAYNLMIIQASDLLGVSLLSFILVFFNITVYSVARSIFQKDKKQFIELSVSISLILFLLIYGSVRINQETENISRAEKIRIGIVQANFDFFEKVEENESLITNEHRRMSMMIDNADLIIWPETSVQKWLPAHAEFFEFFEEEKIIPEIKGTYFLLGGLSYVAEVSEKNENDFEFTQYNSAFLTDWNGKILGKYNKIKLLLFGEYLPFSNIIPWIKNISPATGDFTPGNELNIMNISDKGIKIGPLICYEDIIPSFSRDFALKGANILINLTNDAWFGKSIAPYEHLLVSIPRAVETRRYLIRSTNTGVSAVISPTGEVKKETGIFKKEIFVDEVALLYSDTIYMKIGDIFPWICLIFFVFFVFNKHLRKRYS